MDEAGVGGEVEHHSGGDMGAHQRGAGGEDSARAVEGRTYPVEGMSLVAESSWGVDEWQESNAYYLWQC